MSINEEQKLLEDIAQFYDDPLGFVTYAYPWNKGDLEGFDGPDTWQTDVLKLIGENVRANSFDGRTPVNPIQIAVSSGHGIGKSALVAWIINWILSTRPYSKGILTANTAPQLESKSWAEVIKWTKRSINAHWFAFTAGKGSMRLYHKEHKESWRCDAITCREENSESFAGQHAANSTPFYIFDEASAIPDSIWDVAEGGLTDGEPMWFTFGNPTRNSGRFYNCFHKLKHRWTSKQIDSRTCAMPNKAQIETWREDYGEESDFFKIRVRGLFPSKGENQLINGSIISKAMQKDNTAITDRSAPIIIGADIARFGSDDTVIIFRHGLNGSLIEPLILKQHDTMQTASHIAQILNGTHNHCTGLNIDACFVDGIGIGAGVIDRLKQLGFANIIDVNSAATAHDPKRYHNKRAENYDRFRKWLNDGGKLPNMPRLYEELNAINYQFDQQNRLLLQSKDQIKKQGLGSPDIADAYALTFSEVIPPKDFDSLSNQVFGSNSCYTHDYDIGY
jgi:hypothetical protein